MAQDYSHLHPAEIARRKRQEAKEKAIYSKIAGLKKAHLADTQKERQTTSVIFAIDITQSQEVHGAIIKVVEVSESTDYISEWNPTSIYQLSAAENTIISLLPKEHGAILSAEQCKSLLPTIHRLDKLYALDTENKSLKKLNWSSSQSTMELTFIINEQSPVIEFNIQSGEGANLPINQTVLAVPGLLIRPDNSAFFLNAGDEHIVREFLQSPNQNNDESLKRRLIEQSGLKQIVSDLNEKRFTPRLVIRTARYKYKGHEQLHADLFFQYQSMALHESDERQQIYNKKASTTIIRNNDAENQCKELLRSLEYRWSKGIKEEKGWKLLPSRLDATVRKLVALGWTINAEGKCYRAPVDYEINIQSSHDWFELKADINFGTESIPLPQILKAFRQRKEYIELGDGTFGLLPVEWLTNYTVLSELGRDKNGQLIFSNSQVVILQALLDQKAKVTTDNKYEERLRELSTISNFKPAIEPEGFNGELREYQREALGWMMHLQSLGFGGILALDMGLGKTPTVLSLLQSRIDVEKPSIVVVPRSLIFNWQAEAEKFTPNLKVMVWRGVGRKKHFDKINEYHIILTTYGTLCRDAKLLSSIHFDYCILDESQAIKNSETSNAKAVRAVNSDYRIAMTGTPIENSISELWSQFEFLNPKMIGHAGSFKKINAKKEIVAHDELRKIALSLKPFIFRRTKETVAKDLPGKSEVILYCEMEKEQKKVYEELRKYYRQEMVSEERKEDCEKTQSSSAMLAALMRLRQAACHPGLINDSYSHIPSAKINMLILHLQQILAEGHKVLIFSQFTSMLKLVQREITTLNIDYCYLDGQTNDRAAVVREFQNNEAKKVFMISLKAGGVGLNLTAASYVFLLDPWWNPAIENQAVDRAYRIGQKKKVIAYRMVTKDSVEEKIMKMKNDKLKLAEQVTEYEGLGDGGFMGIDIIEQLLS